MKFRFQPLFAKHEDPSQGQSGGRGPETPSAAADAKGVAAGGPALPFDHESFRQGQHVRLQFAGGKEVIGFDDPVYGFMDARGVKLPEGDKPTGWKPL